MAVLNPQADIQALTNVSALADRRTKCAGLLHDSSGKPRRGVVNGFAGELAVTAPGGLSVSVTAGCAILPAPQPGHGAWSLVNDAPLTLTLATAHPSNGRIDLVIARVADAFYYTGGDNLAAIKVITGTPSTSPAPPAVPATEGSYIVLARVAVAANATSISTANLSKNTIADVPRAPAVGLVVAVADDAGRTALNGLYPIGVQVYQYDTQRIYVGLPGGWQQISLAPDVAAAVAVETNNRIATDGELLQKINDLAGKVDSVQATANTALGTANTAQGNATNAQGRLAAHGW